jgi:3-hydroxyacyl-CoA dehydrogenase / enoyl-CoA hydratase / 3-hydroxybutyryl-CoA epimerase
MSESTYKNWRVSRDDDKIVYVDFDRAGMPVNVFNVEALTEFSDIISALENDKAARGLIIRSAKKDSYIAGADIEKFVQVKSEDEAYDFIKKAHDIFNRLEGLKMPTVAMIHGICLGGGTEMALACDYRVVTDHLKTKMGLPEIMLGIFPGWGGSVRLPRLIGAIQAMGLMLTGRAVSGRAAGKMGIADVVVPLRHLERAARDIILKKPKKHHASTTQSLTNNCSVRKLLANKMRKQVESKKLSKEHYPAPYALIDNWEKHGTSKAAFEGEAKAVSRLIMTETAQNLIRVFFLQQKLKGLGKGVDFKPTHVHVIGAGTMGGDIAAWCALRGMTVTLQDREAKYLTNAMKRAAALFKKKLKKPMPAQLVLDRLIPDVKGQGVEKADVIIEAIFENLEAKQALFKDLEARMKPNAIMATNTSSIPLDEINTVLKNPERLVGIHFFNPVAKMMLVEVVKGDKTSDEVVGKATAFVRKIDKLPLPVKSHPGFLVNRILMPYMMEAMALYQEGVPGRAIDKAAVKFGMPMGPIELADKVGLDICLSVAENQAKYFNSDVPESLKRKVEAGELGVKTGKGLYKYDSKGKAEKPEDGASPVKPQAIQDRLILRFLNESAACLREGIVEKADLLDAGMIFGTGFAPFRGGPMHYAEKLGFNTVKSQLSEYAHSTGDRFNPDAGWDATKNKSSASKKAETVD